MGSSQRLLATVAVVALVVIGLLFTSFRYPPEEDEAFQPASHAQNAVATHPLQPPTTSSFAQGDMHQAIDFVVAHKQRGPSGDLVTGDGFRYYCDAHFDDAVLPIPSAMIATIASCGTVPQRPFVVFVQTHLLDKFVELWLERPHGCRIRLVSHNSDYSAPNEPSNTRWKHGVASTYAFQRKAILDNADVEVWFAQNAVLDHPKLRPIPIGIENRYNKYGQHYDVYEAALARSTPVTSRQKLLFVSFSVKTNPRERNAAMAAARNHFPAEDVTYFASAPPKKSSAATYRVALETFLSQMGDHQFVLAPHGHGVDTHRLWEALYAGCIPIVMHSAMDSKLLSHMPVVLVNSYDELNKTFLLEQLPLMASRFADAKLRELSLKYWAKELRR